MSEVTDVVLVYGLCDDETTTELCLSLINNCCNAGKVYSVDDQRLPKNWYINRKVAQVNIAIGSFNGLDLKEWVREMRQIDFERFGCGFVQLMVQTQYSDGMGIIDVWRGGFTMPAFKWEEEQ